jgi:hypothetical protein
MSVYKYIRAIETEKVFASKVLNFGYATGLNNNYYLYLSNLGVDFYVDGLTVFMKVLNGIDGSGSVTLNINGIGPVPIVKLGNKPLSVGDINDGQIVQVVYDLSSNTFQLQNPSSSYSLLASSVIDDSSHRFVTDSQIQYWNSKQDSLGYIPENISNKGQPGGYASLDGNSKVPLSQIPDISGIGGTKVYVVSGSVNRLAIPTGSLHSGDGCYEYGTGNSYVWDGTLWHLTASRDWANINIDWSNITNIPQSFPPSAHTHTPSDVGLSQVQNVTQIPLSYLDTDPTLSANSDVKISTQKAIKTYVDNKIPTNITSLINKVENLEVCEQIEMDSEPNSGSINKFYDLLNNTNYYSLGVLDTANTTLISLLSAGSNTAQVANASIFSVGQEVTIQSSSSIERKVISAIPDANTLQFSSAANSSYSAAITKVYRSNVEIDTVNKRLKFGKIVAFSDIPERIDPSQVQQLPYIYHAIGRNVFFNEDGIYMLLSTPGIIPGGVLYKRTGDTFNIVQWIDVLGNNGKIGGADKTLTYFCANASGTQIGLFVYKRTGDVFSQTQTLVSEECYASCIDPTGTYIVGIFRTPPYARVYKRSGNTFSFLTELPTSATVNAYNCSIDPTSTYFYVNVGTSPYYYIFKRQGDSFTLVQNLPSGNSPSCWNSDGSLFYNGSLYRRVGDTFTLLSSYPAAQGTAFSPNGLYLVTTYYNSPYIKIYSISGNVLTPIDISTMYIPVRPWGVAFSGDSKYLAITREDYPACQPPYVVVYKYISGDRDATEVDIRYKIFPKGNVSSIFANIQKNDISGFTLEGYVSTQQTEDYIQLDKQITSSFGNRFSKKELIPGNNVTLKIRATKSSPADDAYITKIFGGVR